MPFGLGCCNDMQTAIFAFILFHNDKDKCDVRQQCDLMRAKDGKMKGDVFTEGLVGFLNTLPQL